jgi:glycosyltransferase involved in cell wall biosynthesis
MKILVCNWRDGSHPAAGGAEVYTEEVLSRWAAAGHEVTLFSADQAGRPERETVRGVQRVRRGSRLGVYREARRWFREEGLGRFDIVIDEVNTRPFFAHRFADVPVVALYHQTCEEIWSYEMPWPASWLGRRVLEPRWLEGMRGVPAMAVSQSTKDAIARFGIANTIVVPEGIEPPVPVDVPKAQVPTLVHCSRLVAYKRADHVIEAFGIAQRSIPDLRLVMVGDGPEMASLQRQAPTGVEFVGFVPAQQKKELMASAHAIVMASVREGWGLVIAEAAALGTRAIAYDRPGLRDAVTAAEGVLVPPSPEALAEWIVATVPSWMQTPAPRLPLGGVHSWDDVATAVLEAVIAQTGVADPSTSRTLEATGVA